MKRLFSTILATVLAVSSLTAHAADTRVGRVIPLATRTSFGYTQIIGDRLCLFDNTCTQIADYSAYSEVESGDIYIIDDSNSIYFYNSDGELFLLLSSGTEYYRGKYENQVAVHSGGFLTVYDNYGNIVTSISDEELYRAMEDKKIESFEEVQYANSRLSVLSGIYWTSIRNDSVANPEAERQAALDSEINDKYGYSIAGDDGEGNYIISKSVKRSHDYGIMDKNGNILVSPRFAVLTKPSEGIRVVASSQRYDSCKYAIISDFNSTPNFKYDDYGGPFSEGLIGVEFENTDAYIDKDENIVIDLSGKGAENLGSFSNGKAIVVFDKGFSSHSSVINKSGDTLIDTFAFGYTKLSIDNDLYIMTSYDKQLPQIIVHRPDNALYVTDPVIPADVGTIKRPYYSTDIKVMLDGEPIQGYSMDGKTLIPVEDLSSHGFNVSFDSASRTVVANKRNNSANEPSEVNDFSGNIGDIAGYTVVSDIAAYINGRYVETEAVDGKLLVEVETLGAPVEYSDPDYWMLHYLDLSPYLMSYEYNDAERTLYLNTYNH